MAKSHIAYSIQFFITVDEICIKSGVTKGAFYNHFSSKGQIIVEKFIQIDQRYLEIMEELSGLESSIEKVRSFGRYAIKYMNEMGIRTMRVVYLSQFGDGKKPSFVVSKKRPVYKIVEKMVREGQQKGELRDDMDSRKMTEIIVQSTRGIVYDWCLHNGKYNLEEKSEELFNVILKGLVRNGK